MVGAVPGAAGAGHAVCRWAPQGAAACELHGAHSGLRAAPTRTRPAQPTAGSGAHLATRSTACASPDARQGVLQKTWPLPYDLIRANAGCSNACKAKHAQPQTCALSHAQKSFSTGPHAVSRGRMQAAVGHNPRFVTEAIDYPGVRRTFATIPRHAAPGLDQAPGDRLQRGGRCISGHLHCCSYVCMRRRTAGARPHGSRPVAASVGAWSAIRTGALRIDSRAQRWRALLQPGRGRQHGRQDPGGFQ